MKYASVYVVLILVAMFSATSLQYQETDAQKSTSSKNLSAKLSLFVVPPKIPADNDSYKNIYVTLVDSKNTPTTTTEKLEVTLSSSATNIGTVDSSVTIEAGSYYAVATFHSTDTAGATTISATASGFASAQTTVTTIKSSDINPTKLNVVALPSPMLPLEGSEGMVIVQLLNSNNSPVVALNDVTVTLDSSNKNVVEVDSSVTIPKGQVYAIAKSRTAAGSGQSTITASADGLTPATAAASTGTSTASTLKAYPLPPTISASGAEGGWVAVQLEDSAGVPIRSSQDVNVSLLSSNDRILVPKDPSIVIRKGQSIVVAKVLPGGVEGKASLTPLASGLLSVPGDVSAVKPTFDAGERKMLVYSAPPNPDPSASNNVLVAAQIQGKNNAPAPVFRTTRVQVSSSNLDLGKFNNDLAIEGNNSFGIVSLDLVGLSGETTVTVSAANFKTQQLKITTKGKGGLPTLDLVPTSQNIPAYNAPYPAFLVMVKSGSIPMKAPSDISVFLSSSSSALADVPSIVKITKGSAFGVVSITPKGFPGTITLTAKSDGFQQVVKSVALTEFNPSSLAIFTAFPALLPSSDQGDPLVIVQLQNSKGEPRKNLVSDTNVSISINPTSVGTVEQNVVIPKGANFATAKIFLSTVQGDATVSVNTEGFKLASTKFKTIVFPFDVQLTIYPANININQTATLTAKVTSGGTPVPNAKVKWTYDASSADLVSSSEATNEAGEVKAAFIPRKEVPQQIRALLTKPGYITQESSLNFDLGQNAAPTNRLQLSADFLSIALVLSIIAEGFVIYYFYQKKRPLF